MSSLSRELVFLILQFLDEENFKETIHKLEQESGFFFNMKYFEDQVANGNWEEVERYVSGFTKWDDNRYSLKTFFEIRKQKYLEALDKKDRPKAVDILMKDLKVFASFNEEIFKEITQLLTLDNFRENEQLSTYGDEKSARAIVLVELKKLVEINPLICDKLQFPYLKSSRLQTLINQSLNWQHQLCKNPRPNPDIKTLFVDHSCTHPNGAPAPSPEKNSLLGGPVLKPPFQSCSLPVPAPLAALMSNTPNGDHPADSSEPLGLSPASIPAALHPRTPPTNPFINFPSGDSAPVPLPVAVLPELFPRRAHSQISNAFDDLPKTLAWTFNLGSSPLSMDFHPIQQNLLLVGTNVGDIGLWEVGSRESLVQKNFKVWDMSTCTVPLQAVLLKDPVVLVNRVIWSPDGSLFGVAYSRHLVQIFSFNGNDNVHQHLEIDAHVGRVNDLAFLQPNKQLSVITCGDDKLIKVWDATTGAKLYSFEGHEAPVYSICPHEEENIPFILSTDIDGKIKGWLYNNQGSQTDGVAPGCWCTTMAFSADGTRLFSCSTSKDGESHIVEWNVSEGYVKRTYEGLRKRSLEVVQFDTTKSRFLAAGDGFSIKFWDMDYTQVLATVEADGNLPETPRIRFNKDGTLLAVSAKENGIIILANTDGFRLLGTYENLAFNCSSASEAAKPTVNDVSATASSIAGLADRVASVVNISVTNGDVRNLGDVNQKIAEETNIKSTVWKVTEINDPSQCRSLKLPRNSKVTKMSRLIYTNSGNAILALASNANHLLWKWQQTHLNSSGKATADASPQLWQPSAGSLMVNDVNTNLEDAVPCFALSKNDSYVISASGGKISLFNMLVFKVMTTFMPPPPSATFIALHPQDNNIIAIGMDDSTIQIYNIRAEEVKCRLTTDHSKRITGLAFSQALNVMVSSGADAKICVWGSDEWEMQKSINLRVPSAESLAAESEIHVQFHKNQINLLVVQETLLAIYEVTKLECMNQWNPPQSSALISHATFSCDGQLVYATFLDATVCMFNATDLRLNCRINPSAYISSNISNSSLQPLMIAAHPQESNQFAIGMSDGSVHVFEPLESDGKWGGAVENTTPLVGASASDHQAQNMITKAMAGCKIVP